MLTILDRETFGRKLAKLAVPIGANRRKRIQGICRIPWRLSFPRLAGSKTNEGRDQDRPSRIVQMSLRRLIDHEQRFIFAFDVVVISK